MLAQPQFQPIFDQLKPFIKKYAKGMTTTVDDPDAYSLDTKYIMKNQKPLYFGAVKINKRYVSYHLMPVYVFPELLNDISPELKARMQGKFCFNFTKPDDTLFKELKALTRTAYMRYQDAGYC
jgi:hypothetical protein